MYYHTSYEEYMQNVLGYMPNSNIGCDFEENCVQSLVTMPKTNCTCECNLEECYPELYKKIYPSVLRECKNISGPINNEMIEKMTETIYQSIEVDLKIGMKNQRQTDYRQIGIRDNVLRDLIKILIIREILKVEGGPGGSGPRPPFPPNPRPPFPGGPGPRPQFPPTGPMRPR